MRKHPIIVTANELELIVTLLKRHVSVAQYEKTDPKVELTLRMERLLEIAKDLEPL